MVALATVQGVAEEKVGCWLAWVGSVAQMEVVMVVALAEVLYL